MNTQISITGNHTAGDQTRAAASAESSSKRSVEDDEATVADAGTSSDLASKFKAFSESRKTVITTACSSLTAALAFLVERYVKCGGELAASKCGGIFSVGGRAARVGLSRCLAYLLYLQSAHGGIGLNSLSTANCLRSILNMVGEFKINELENFTSFTRMINVYFIVAMFCQQFWSHKNRPTT